MHCSKSNSPSKPLRILISAREASADQHAAGVVRALRECWDHPVEIFGLGGPCLLREGLLPLSPQPTPTMGFGDVMRQLPDLIRLLQHTAHCGRTTPTDAALLVDAPDFNLPLGHRLKRAGIPVFSLCAPQAWAWRERRARSMHRDIDTLLALFPFEGTFFQERGVDTHVIGHPHAWDALHTPPTSRDTLLIMPGSRRHEIKRLAPPMLQAIPALTHIAQTHRVVIPIPPGWTSKRWKDTLPPHTTLPPNITFSSPSPTLFARAKLAVCTSGTACLQTTLACTPTIVLYITDPLSWTLARVLVRSPWIAMPNILLQRNVCPELLQRDASPQTILHAATYLTTDPTASQQALSPLASSLLLDNHTHPYTHAARTILQRLQTSN